jgi:hypothetical protein
MELDQFLSQPPQAVRDNGFSQAVALGLYQKRRRHHNLLRGAAILLLLALLALLPGIWVREIPLLLMALLSSPLVAYLGGGLVLLLALQPRLLRF